MYAKTQLGSEEVTDDPGVKQLNKQILSLNTRVNNCHIKAKTLALKLGADQEPVASGGLNLLLLAQMYLPVKSVPVTPTEAERQNHTIATLILLNFNTCKYPLSGPTGITKISPVSLRSVVINNSSQCFQSLASFASYQSRPWSIILQV